MDLPDIVLLLIGATLAGIAFVVALMNRRRAHFISEED
jgi:hypothetical protein